MHASLQFSDSKTQKESDAEKIFARATKRKIAWITGTELGGGNEVGRAAIKSAAEASGYRFVFKGGDCWVAVEKSRIKGGFKADFEKVIDGKSGQFTDKGVLSVTWDDTILDRVTVLTAHYLTKGRPNSKDPQYGVRLPENTLLAQAIGAKAKEAGKGPALVFYGGDQNISDRTDDTFLGEPLTSTWDELQKWENTGHGNIDVIASYDPDRRVKAAYVRALDDKEFHLHSDHFLVESGFDVQVTVRPPQPEPVPHDCPLCGHGHVGVLTSTT